MPGNYANQNFFFFLFHFNCSKFTSKIQQGTMGSKSWLGLLDLTFVYYFVFS